VVLRDARIDYGGFLGSEFEREGLRVLQGDGAVTVKWSIVASIRMTGTDDSVKPARVQLEILLRDGRKFSATLARVGRMLLLGTTDLGEYTIALDKLRVIEPIVAPHPPSARNPSLYKPSVDDIPRDARASGQTITPGIELHVEG
jgi:hypothetical protein